jgi:hypothetical protein
LISVDLSSKLSSSLSSLSLSTTGFTFSFAMIGAGSNAPANSVSKESNSFGRDLVISFSGFAVTNLGGEGRRGGEVKHGRV